MSNPILDSTDGTKTVQFSTMWKAMAAAGFAMLSFICMMAITWGFWVTNNISAHNLDIAVLKERAFNSNGKGVSQSVNVGQAKDAELVNDDPRTWLTTKDVAARIGNGVTERTVINYIEQGMIEPAPVKNGKSWQIAENFRIIPNESENCGTFPNETGP